MKRHDKAPNGYFAEGLILYGNLETGAMASQGFSSGYYLAGSKIFLTGNFAYLQTKKRATTMLVFRF